MVPRPPLIRRVPNLHLRTAAQINSAVSFRRNFPIHPQLNVAVVFFADETLSLAVKFKNAVLRAPMLLHFFVGILLPEIFFFSGEFSPPWKWRHKTFPA